MKKTFFEISVVFFSLIFSISAFAEPVNGSSDSDIDTKIKESATVTETDGKTVSVRENALTDTDSEDADSDDSQSAESLSAPKVSAVETATWAEIKMKFKDF